MKSSGKEDKPEQEVNAQVLKERLFKYKDDCGRKKSITRKEFVVINATLLAVILILEDILKSSSVSGEGKEAVEHLLSVDKDKEYAGQEKGEQAFKLYTKSARNGFVLVINRYFPHEQKPDKEPERNLWTEMRVASEDILIAYDQLIERLPVSELEGARKEVEAKDKEIAEGRKEIERLKILLNQRHE